jgi:IS1 family transposase
LLYILQETLIEAKRVRPEDSPLLGDCYVWVGIERHSKLVLNITMGKRDQHTCNIFVEGLRHATARTPFQITTDASRRTVRQSPRRCMIG